MRVPESTLNNEMNVTPFLDVLLVLMVIFLSTIQAQRLLEAQLPVPSRRECPGCETIVLEVQPSGEYALNQAAFPRTELASRLHAAFDGRPTSVLFVKADSGVRYQDVVTAMDGARGAGVKVLAIATRDVR
jgi:biopolymer transport protein TolR